MPTTTISINRAPVLTLWAAIVAKRLGFNRNEALTLGRAVAGLNAQSKGRRLGVFDPHAEKPKSVRVRRGGRNLLVEVRGRGVPAIVTPDGVRALTRDKAIDPGDVEEYLEDKFGDDLKRVRAVMRRWRRATNRSSWHWRHIRCMSGFGPRSRTGSRAGEQWANWTWD
jgi:hypothetical protein